ncbi:MAG: 3-dehydroquinate dehydratase [Alphaproteobacteria bacterium]|nr:3-dehydroquinate dehydratase [Alphaproteobacteria bacterium]
MATRIGILNGPNLDLLGVREPQIYGTTTLAEIERDCRAFARKIGVALDFKQSNHEGQLIDWIHAARGRSQALIVNPAGCSFVSVALFDAMKAFAGPIYEVHISNIHARDEMHRHSKLSAAATGVVAGLGPYGYVLALQAAARAVGHDRSVSNRKVQGRL